MAEGARASVGEVLAEIAAERAGAAGPRALPRVRALASELGVELAGLRPPGEIVTEEDVRAAAEGGRTREPGENSEGAAHAPQRVPLRGVRREIANHMTDAAAVPTVTVVEECDFSALTE